MYRIGFVIVLKFYLFNKNFFPSSQSYFFSIQWPRHSQAVLSAQEPAASPASHDDPERSAAGESSVELHHPADGRPQTHSLG